MVRLNGSMWKIYDQKTGDLAPKRVQSLLKDKLKIGQDMKLVVMN